MGALDKALENVDRALAIFPTTDGEQAGAYSTRAMILRDAGSEAEAVEWFQKAFLARMEQASPDLASAADDLDGEIALLKKLGRTDDIIEAEAKLAAIHRTLQDTPESGSNFDAAKGFDQGMVLVELAIGGKQRKLSGSDRLVSAIRKLVEAIQSQGVGELSGDITIPESTTLIFSGRDADKLFDVLGPLLRSEPVCAGARIVVRQGDAHREIAIPHSPTGLN